MVVQPVGVEAGHQLPGFGDQGQQAGVTAGGLQHLVGEGLVGVVAQVLGLQVHDLVHRDEKLRLPRVRALPQAEAVGQGFLRLGEGVLVGIGGVGRAHPAGKGHGGGHPGLEGGGLPHPQVLEAGGVVLHPGQKGTHLPQAAVVGEDQVHHVPVLALAGGEGRVEGRFLLGVGRGRQDQQAQGQRQSGPAFRQVFHGRHPRFPVFFILSQNTPGGKPFSRRET